MNEFKMGKEVKVVKKFVSTNASLNWIDGMDKTLNKVGVISSNVMADNLVRVYFSDFEDFWWYDTSSLELMPEEAEVSENTQTKDTNPKDLIGSKKAKLSVIPAGVMFEVGLGLLEGACKYGRHNYRAAGVRSSVYYDATLGHLMDWWEGQDIDVESGLSHVTKALSSLVVLRDAMLQDMLTDDRPPRSKVFKADFNDKASSIIDIHSDKNPKHYTQKDME